MWVKKTKYMLIERDGYNPIATTWEVIDYMRANPDYMGSIRSVRPVTMVEIRKEQIRIYSTETHRDKLDVENRREKLFKWAASVTKGTVSWFDKVSGEGMIECNGERLPIYACNIKGRKTWYPETACVYYEPGQVVDCHIDVHGWHKVFCIGDTAGYIDQEAWDRIKDKELAFRCNEDGEAVTGLFSAAAQE